jgi:hypothetical protein
VDHRRESEEDDMSQAPIPLAGTDADDLSDRHKAILAEIRHKLERRDRTIAELRAERNGFDMEITTLRARLALRDATIGQLERWLKAACIVIAVLLPCTVVLSLALNNWEFAEWLR